MPESPLPDRRDSAVVVRTDSRGGRIPSPPGPYDYWEAKRLRELVACTMRRFGWWVYVVPAAGGNWVAHLGGTYWTSASLGGSTSNGERLVPNPPDVPWTNEAAFFNPYGRAIEMAKERIALLTKRGFR